MSSAAEARSGQGEGFSSSGAPTIGMDDFFLVFKDGRTIQLRDRDVEPSEGELFGVPRVVELRR